MKLEFGDIVLLKFPFTSTLAFKIRPALVITDTKDGDIIVCRITSKIYNTDYDIELPRWGSYNLKLPSVIRVHKIASLELNLIDSKIGQIDSVDQRRVQRALTILFTRLTQRKF